MAKCVIEYIKDHCSKKTSNYHHGNLKEELLQQAVDIIHTEGIDSLTLSALSKRLGTSRSAIYRHFSSKDELMHNVLLYGFELFDNKIAPVFLLKEKDVLERFYIMGKEYVQFAIDHPNLYRILFGERFQNIREDACDIEDEKQGNGFHALVGLLIEGQEKGILKVDAPMLQAQIIHSMVHGLASLCIDGHLNVKENIDDLFEMAYKTLTQGLSVNK